MHPVSVFDPAREKRDAHTRQTSNSEAGYTDAEHIGSNSETGGNNRTQRLEITKRIVGLPPGFGAGVVAILSGVHQAKVFDNVEVAQRTLRQMSSSIEQNLSFSNAKLIQIKFSVHSYTHLVL